MSEVIYLVSAGCYSGYRILAAFTDKSVAEQVVEKMIREDRCSDNPSVKEMAMNPEVLNNPLTAFRVNMDYDTGDHAEVSLLNVEDSLRINAGVEIWGRKSDAKRCNTHCWAENPAHAIKIANERRTMHKAMKGGKHE